MSPSSFKPNNLVGSVENGSPIPKFSRKKSYTRGSTLESIKRNSLSRSSDDISGKPNLKISNIIGDFGPYQIAVLVFSALRAMCCSMDGLSGPFLSPNVKDYKCIDCLSTINQPQILAKRSIETSPHSISSGCSQVFGNSTYEIASDQCYFYSKDSNLKQRIPCTRWSFDFDRNKALTHTLSIEQSLVCDHEWLKSLSNSMYFVGATLGLLFWGFISDKYGRKTAYVYSHIVTLIFGFCSLFATNMRTYIMLRMMNSFGMIGELVPRSIVVESVAAKYRFICSVVCQTGWATGIILVPLLSYINPSYKFILSIPVIISALMLPWLYFLPESARWLIINNKFQQAREELIRAAKINGKFSDQTSAQVLKFNNQVLREETQTSGPGSSRLGIWRSLLAIFSNIQLLKNTISVFLLLFVAEVVYFSLTLNVADLGGSMHLNYIISGFSELVSIALCGLMLAYFSRRMCLSVLLLLSTLSYLLMALTNMLQDSFSMSVILGVNAFAKITAIGNLMVIILVSQEVFPTVIRQFGTSLCITVGKAGSAVAPFTHELGQSIGHAYCFGMFSLVCLSCSFVPLGLSETGSCELPDTVIDIEENKRACDEEKSNAKMHKFGARKGTAETVLSDITALEVVDKSLEDDPNNNDSSETVPDLNEKFV